MPTKAGFSLLGRIIAGSWDARTERMPTLAASSFHQHLQHTFACRVLERGHRLGQRIARADQR